MRLPHHRPTEPNARSHDPAAVVDVKFAVDAIRTVRMAIMKLAYAIGEVPGRHGYLLLVDTTITEARLRAEWRRAEAVMRRDVVEHLSICLMTSDGRVRGIPADPSEEVQRWLRESAAREASNSAPRNERPDYGFVVLKVLLHQWLLKREPVTLSWLAQTAGCSYPTVARVLKSLGSAVVREADRSVVLRSFPHQEFTRLLAVAGKARSTVRFADRSGQPRPPDAHLRRLEMLRPVGVAIGGVHGARHYLPALDLVGAPRLDLSVHCGKSPLDVGFIHALDPALEQVTDPHAPANVVVHAVRHADPLFTQREAGLSWADPIECLLDLYGAGLEAQAIQFFNSLGEPRGAAHEW